MNTIDLEKRRTLQLALASVGSSLLTACGGDGATAQAGYLYAMTNATTNGIVQMQRDPSTGALSMVTTTLTTGAGSNKPSVRKTAPAGSP